MQAVDDLQHYSVVAAHPHVRTSHRILFAWLRVITHNTFTFPNHDVTISDDAPSKELENVRKVEVEIIFLILT